VEYVVRRGRVVEATKNPPNNTNRNPPPHQATKAPAWPTVTATRETGRPKNPDLKSTTAPQRASGKSKKIAVASVKTAAAMEVPTQNPNSHPRTSQISSITFLSTNVWRSLVGFSRPSLLNPQGQLALALSSRPSYSS